VSSVIGATDVIGYPDQHANQRVIGHPARWTQARPARVAQALSSVHAMGPGVAEALQDDFDLALNVRQPGGLSQVSPRQRGTRHTSHLVRHHLGPPAAAGSGAAAAVGGGSAAAAGSGSGVFS
jgi:hypothetical protein